MLASTDIFIFLRLVNPVVTQNLSKFLSHFIPGTVLTVYYLLRFLVLHGLVCDTLLASIQGNNH